MNASWIDALRLRLASPEQIRSWSRGEVTHASTINYRTGIPDPDGLFSQRIFGPVRDYHCACGKYRHPRTPGFICEVCGVELTRRVVRRERMGHIMLCAPVVHTWYAMGVNAPLGLLLGLTQQELQAVLAGERVLVTAIDDEMRTDVLTRLATGQHAEKQPLLSFLQTLTVGDFLSDETSRLLHARFGRVFETKQGTAALHYQLSVLDLDTLARRLRAALLENSQVEPRLEKRLAVVEAFRASGVQPTSMILSMLPVMPPELRPLVPIDHGHYASSDVNTLYERILQCNARLRHLEQMQAPQIMLSHERRTLQHACNALFDNRHQPHPVRGPRRVPLASLTDRISGKQGRFRHNLLGKRVDYSGRSVIVGDPTLRLDQCGLPTAICLELFKPFLIRALLLHGRASTPRAAKRLLERPDRHSLLWDMLEEVMYNRVVLLNRAPTLHRPSIQAFFPRRTEGSALHLHPLVCSAFNADFDGDQMAVHLPLSLAAQREAKALLLSTRNLRSPANGEPAISISQEMVLGLFYLTQERPTPAAHLHAFSSREEVELARAARVIDLHTPITVRLSRAHRIETTAGRLLVNAILPADFGYRNAELTKDALRGLIAECLERCGQERTARLADDLKRLGFTYATRSGISFAISDIPVPSDKQRLLERADDEAETIEEQHRAGMMTREERSEALIALWTDVTNEISARLEASLDPWGSLSTIIKSGATKAKFQQIRQLSGIRGLMARPNGSIIDIPIRGNYLQGLSVRESFIAASAARNGFMGRSLSTATTGHLTRRLVETGMEVWITMEDCGTQDGWIIEREAGSPEMQSRIVSRYLAEAVGPYKAGTLLSRNQASELATSGVKAVRARSVLCCQAPYGVCQRCYGADLATGLPVRLGMAVGIIAGQSIGEPGTQLAMKAFHSGGIANAAGDIRGGLPRIIDLFEARHPNGSAMLSPISGTIRQVGDATSGIVALSVVGEEHEVLWRSSLPSGKMPLSPDGARVEAGAPLSAGPCDPHTLLSMAGREATARYLIAEVQQVFRTTGVVIHEKHLECIVRQMLRWVEVVEAGDTSLVPGAILDGRAFRARSLAILAQGGAPARARPRLLGLTKVALHSTSWVAAASFQETSRVLRDGALAGRSDPLRGFKERGVIGLPLPRSGRVADQHEAFSVKPCQDSDTVVLSQ